MALDRLATVALSAALALTISACGDGSDPDVSATNSGTSTDASNGTANSSNGGNASNGAPNNGSTSADTTPNANSGTTPTDGPLAASYPGDDGLADDPAVLFFDDFEAGWGRWSAPSEDTAYLTLESDEALANSGTGYLRSTVTFDDLADDQYISSSTRADFPRRVDTVYWRFYARFPNVAPNPHHWIRMAAGTESWASSGLANTVPPGDEGFWFDFDISNENLFNFYVYWHQMRSGRCNDGSTTPGCEGDQGTTYHYGNVFRPNDQTPYPRDEWFCIEIGAGANTVGQSDGWLEFYIDDQLVGRYAPGEPDGTWLRATFHEDGCNFSACTEPAPFEGFDFRISDDVRFKQIFMDAYYERDSAARKRDALVERGLTVSEEQTILYDDVVVATERIGCRR